VIDGEPLTPAAAVLAGIAVPPQDVLLVEGHPIDERLADEHGEANHRGQREHHGRRADHTRRSLDGLGFAGEEQSDGAASVGEMQRLKRVVEHQYRNLIHIACLG
jgi:hypothetical protein